MCTSYEPSHRDEPDAFDLFPLADFDYKREIYKDYAAPIFRRGADGYSTDPATFGMVPRKYIPPNAKLFDTMNARSETVAERRSFRGSWNRLRLCLIPCKWFFEPNYETGKAVRWRIGMADGSPFAIAGLWRAWDEPDEGGQSLSFTMLTVNSNDHPLMKRFHRPGDEKRSVVIVPRASYEDWLGCASTDEARSFLSLYPVECMHAEAFPLPPRKPKAELAATGQATLL
jgi:putative SOS response-associated peptidase YedK